MTNTLNQLSALLKKNWIIKKRTAMSSFVELIFPILLGVLMISLRQIEDLKPPEEVDSSILLPSFPMPVFLSTAPLPGFSVCNITQHLFMITPETNETRAFVDYLKSQCSPYIVSFENVTFFEDAATLNTNVSKTIEGVRSGEIRFHEDQFEVFGLIFESFSPNWEYRLRSYQFPRGDEQIADAASLEFELPGFYAYGEKAAPLQILLNEWILDMEMESSVGPMYFGKYFQTHLSLFPMAPSQIDAFFSVAMGAMTILAVLFYLWPFSRLVRLMVEEKEQKLRVGMVMMGMNDTLVWASWYITYSIIFFVSTVALTIIFSGIMTHTSVILIFLYFFLFTLSLTSFGFFLSAFFSTTKTAVMVALLVHIGSFVVYDISDNYSAFAKSFIALLPATNFALGWETMAAWESTLTGITSENIALNVKNFSLLTNLLMSVMDIFLYFFLAWYVSNVIPSEFGTRKPLNFLFTKKYWSPASTETVNPDDIAAPVDVNEKNFEKPSEEVARRNGIKIRNLVKQFGSQADPVLAVNELYLDMYEDQVFSLLGHNGAGKTTTISMLTGLIEVDNGDAFIFGNSVKNDMDKIHSSLGICPQHNVLFDKLTVREHLEFFANIKNVPREEQTQIIPQLIIDIGLANKADSTSETLSGGMKRMLSVGIAFIGEPRVVFLDEPTSGMDVNARRQIWDIIKRKKKGKVIVLTTHFMDEADILGDRIAIMAKGKVVCNGSSLFLKSRYGVGYTLVVSKSQDSPDQAAASAGLRAVLDKHLTEGGYEVVNDIGSELFLRMPFESSAHFPEVFREFDSRKEELMIENYSVSVTTLEEVFLKVGEHSAETKEERSVTRSVVKDLNSGETGKVSSISKLVEKSQRFQEKTLPDKVFMWFIQVRAILSKNMKTQMRDKTSVFCNLILPMIALSAGLLSVILADSFVPGPFETTLGHYPQPVEVAFYGNSDFGNLVQSQFVDVNGSDISKYELEPATGIYTTKTDLSEFTKIGLCLPSPIGLYYCDDIAYEFGNAIIEHTEASETPVYGAYSVFNVSRNLGNISVPVNLNLIYVNNSAPHALPIFANALSNALLKAFNATTTATIKVAVDRFTGLTSVDEAIAGFISFILPLVFAIFPAGFVIPVVKERETNSKLQQIISGVSISAYWIGNFLFDLCQYSIPVLLSLMLILASETYFFTGDDKDFSALISLLFLYGTASIPFAYLMSMFFKNGNTARNIIFLFNILTGFVLSLTSFILDFFESTQGINSDLQQLFHLFPAYSLSKGLFKMRLNYQPQKNPFDYDIAGESIISLAWKSPFYLGLNLFLTYIAQIPSVEFKLREIFGRVPTVVDDPIKEDEDVLVEKEAMQTGQKNDKFIQIKGLRKLYGHKFPTVAVRDLWLSIAEGEVFGFLGAGKTTTLNVLSGDTPPTSGEVLLNQMNIIYNASEIRRMIGYCPQFDALFPLLTGREHLTYYARIKGVDEENIQEVVTGILHYLSLDEYGDRPAGTYSGGNKRKLSAAISLIGNPSVVFLDEISTGVDPISRRFMWRFISETKKGRSAILTTHSMEECEALCNRIGIMVEGSMKCLGTPHHIKNRFGQGFQLELQVDEDRKEAVRQFVLEKFAGSSVLEEHGGRFKFHLENVDGMPISTVFELIEGEKERLSISQYSVSNTTLEQIFIYFAKKMDEKKEQEALNGGNTAKGEVEN